MSKKGQQLDVLGEAHLPDDVFTDSDALNGLLDTYPDLGKGMGVLDHETLGDSKQAPTLPDGVVLTADEVDEETGVVFGGLGDLGDITREAGLADLSWLDLAEQDPERLPKNPVDRGIPELEQAWGVDRRTDGLVVLPNVDRDVAAYEASLAEDVKTASRMPKDVVDHVVQTAWRRVTAGEAFATVASEVAQRLGDEASRVAKRMAQMKDDAGLIGRVFVRASNYPGCESGRWTDTVKKQGATARYLVQKKACEGCVHAQNGSCSIFHKKLVAAVPWDEAKAKYGPVLEATGRRVASNQEPKEALRRAFAQVPRGLSQVGDVRPVAVHLADTVTPEEARKALASVTGIVTVVDVSREQVHRILASWRQRGMLTPADHEKLVASDAAPAAVLKAATGLISAVRTADYSGGQNAGKMGYAADRETALRELHAAEDRTVQATAFLREEVARRERAASREGKRVAAIERKCAQVRKEIDNGLRGKKLVAHILRTFEAADRGLAAEILDPYIRSKNALEEPRSVAAPYSGLSNDVRISAEAVSASDAWARLREASTPSAIDLAERRKAQAHRKLVGTLSRWVRDGLLQKSAAERLARSDADPHDVLRVASALIGRARVAEYSGVANDARVPEVSPEEAWRMLAAAEDQVRRASEKLAAEAARRTHAASREGRREAAIRAKVAKITAAIEKGLRGQPLLNLIRKTIARDEVAAASKILDPILAQTGALEATASGPREFQGPHYERAPTEAPKVASGPAYGETDRLLRWARQQMNEGAAGHELDQLLAGRFAHSVRTAAEGALKALRRAHEGLAGHAYVDAEAYASKAGIAGCEKGALRHRANTIPAVLQMNRCGSCALRQAKADGTPVCSLYNKKLVASAAEAVEDPRAYQAEMIRLADGTDADRTAAMFTNAYDPGEYQLGVDSELDNLRVAETPPNEDVGEVLFGGLEFE